VVCVCARLPSFVCLLGPFKRSKKCSSGVDWAWLVVVVVVVVVAVVMVMMAAHCLMSRAACCLLRVFAVRVQPPRSTLPACLPAQTQGLPPSPQQCLNSLCVEDWVVVFI